MISRIRSIDRPIALLVVMAFTVQVGVAVMLPLLPLYATSLGASPFVLGLLTSSFAVTFAIGQLGSGFIVGRVPVRRLVAGGMSVYAIANILIATANAAIPLLAFRAVAGLGAGLNLTAERLYLIGAVSRRRLAFSNGILSAAASAGAVAGPALGGVLAAISDLRAPFVLVGITSLLASIAALFLPKPAGEGRAKAVEATDRPREHGMVEGTARVLAALFVVQFAFEAAFGAFITTYAQFATTRLAWSIAEVGIVFSLFGLGSIALGPWLARRADERGRRDIAMVGAALVFGFSVAYVAEAPRLVLYPVTILAGAGLTAFEASWFAMLGDATDGGRRSRVFGAMAAFTTLGIVAGANGAAQAWERSGDVGLGLVVAAGAVFASAVGLVALPRDRGAMADAEAEADAEADQTADQSAGGPGSGPTAIG